MNNKSPYFLIPDQTNATTRARLKTPKIKAISGLGSLVVLIVAAFLAQPLAAQSSTDVCLSYSPEYKVSYAIPVAADPDPLETYEDYFTDNREIIQAIGWCTINSGATALRFQIWTVLYKKNGTGALTLMPFGGAAQPQWTCTPPFTPITQDLVQFTTFIDEEDIEGFRFYQEDGTELNYKANWNIPGPLLQLGGRPIGFKAQFGENSEGSEDMPLAMQLIYNSCMCPLSYFVEKSPLTDFEVTVGVDPTPLTQPIDEQQDRINQLYRQDCGGYSLSLSPSLSFLSLESAGGSFTDTLVLDGFTNGDVGVYDVQLVVSNPIGYTLPVPGNLPEITYDFRVTINPCPLTDVIATPSTPETVEYQIGDPGTQTGPYNFDQGSCNYQAMTVVSSSPDLPTYIVHDEANQKFVIDKVTDLNAVAGTYTITVTQTITVMTDTAQTQQSIEKSVTFIIVVTEACIGKSMELTSALPDPLEYTLGTFGSSHSFEVDYTTNKPDCVLPVVYSFSISGAMPNMLTIPDPAVSTVEFAQSFDLTQRGEYPDVELLAQFTQIDGSILQVTQQLTVNVYPCPIDLFMGFPDDLGIVQYTLGDPGFTFGEYFYFQYLECGYPEDESLVGSIPDSSFFKYLKDENRFEILSTEEISYAGSYPMDIESSISVPIGLDKSPTYKVEEIRIKLTVKVINPCLTTVLDPITVDDMATTVKGVADLQDLTSTIPQDSVSQVRGSGDGLTYCGERQFRITSDGHENYLSFNDLSYMLTLLAYDNADIGDNIQVSIEAYLVDYPNITSQTTFTVDISACIIENLEPQLNEDKTYSLETPAVFDYYTIKSFIKTPACSDSITYTYQVLDVDTGARTPLPSFISNIPPGGRTLSMFSQDPAAMGTYRIVVTGTSQSLTAETEFNLLVIPGACFQETVAPDGALGPFDYFIGSPLVPLEPTWTSSVDFFTCPSNFAIYRIEDDDTRRSLSPDEETVLDFDAVNGFVDLETSDFTLANQSWTIWITKESIYSNADQNGLIGPLGIYIVEINFFDACESASAVITAAAFDESEVSFDLYEAQTILFTDFESNTECGGITQDLIYVSGPLRPSPSDPEFDLSGIYTLNPGKVTGMVTQRTWLGTHTFIIRGYNGKKGSALSPRGDDGIFESLDSAPIEVTIVDPCSRTVIDFNDSFRSDFSKTIKAPIGKETESVTVDGPQDEISDQSVPSGYDFCGPLQYDLTDINGQKLPASLLDFDVEYVSDAADKLTLTLHTLKSGNEVSLDIKMKVSLIGYPSAAPIEVRGSIVFRECAPTQYEAPIIPDQIVEVGDQPRQINVEFSQFPCVFEQTKYAVLVNSDSGSEENLPDFINYFSGDEIVTIGKVTDKNVGEYIVRVYGILDNFASTTVSTTFTVFVEGSPPEPVVIEYKPEWYPLFVDQTIYVGQSLDYTPEIEVIDHGWAYDLKVHLNIAAMFATYDPQSGQIQIQGSSLTNEDVGSYEIGYVATFTKGEKIIRKQASFWVTILKSNEPTPNPDPDPSPNPGPTPVVPGEDDDYPEWLDPIEPNLIPEDDDGDDDGDDVNQSGRPKPFVKSLSDLGLLTIGWDRLMALPSDYRNIPEEKVAISDWSAFDKEDIEHRLDFGIYTYPDEDVAFWFAIIDALEVRIIPSSLDDGEEPYPIKFTWKMVSYLSSEMQLQLDIENPQRLAQSGNPAELAVTFWGTELFKDRTNQEVRYGTTLKTPIFRQINQTEAETIDNFVPFNAGTTFIIIFCICVVGAQLPTWMFLNSLSLIVHTILLNSLMPPSVWYIFKEYLHLVRLNIPAINEEIEETYEVHDYAVDQGLYNFYLKAADYYHLFARNLVIVISSALAIIIVWVVVAIIDEVTRVKRAKQGRRGKRQRKEPYVNNFLLRFFYELFLDICICVLVNVTLVDFDNFSPTVQYVVSATIGFGIVLYVAWLFSLLCFRGPYIEGFYDKGTAWQSLWTARPFDIDFNAQFKATQKRVKKKRAKMQTSAHRLQSEGNTGNKVQPLEPFQNLEMVETERPLINGTPSKHHSRTDLETQNNSIGVIKFSPNASIDLEEDHLRQSNDDAAPLDNPKHIFSTTEGENLDHTTEHLPTPTPELPLAKQKTDKIFDQILFENSLAEKKGKPSPQRKQSNKSSIVIPKKVSAGPTPASTVKPTPDKRTRKPAFGRQGTDDIIASLQLSTPDLEYYKEMLRSVKKDLQSSVTSAKKQQQFTGQKSDTIQVIEEMMEDETLCGLRADPSVEKLTPAAKSSNTGFLPPIHESQEKLSNIKFNEGNGNDSALREDLEGGEPEDNSQHAVVTPMEELSEKSGSMIKDQDARLLSSQKKTPESRSDFMKSPAAVSAGNQSSRISREQEDIIKDSAKEIVAGTELIKKPIRHKTLYYGLKMNHPRNVAIVHPIMFTMRRIVYAVSVVTLASVPLFGVWILLFGTLAMMAYALLEWQWKDNVINWQHIFNETTTYIVCIFLLMFTNYVSADVRVLLGYFLIGFFVCFLVYNSIIMLLYLCRNIILWLRRLTTRSRREKLKSEAGYVLQRLRQWLTSARESKEKDWFVPDDLDYIWDAELRRTSYGGVRVEIIEVADPLKADRYDQEELKRRLALQRRQNALRMLSKANKETSMLSSISEQQSDEVEESSLSSMKEKSSMRIELRPSIATQNLGTIMEVSDSEQTRFQSSMTKPFPTMMQREPSSNVLSPKTKGDFIQIEGSPGSESMIHTSEDSIVLSKEREKKDYFEPDTIPRDENLKYVPPDKLTSENGEDIEIPDLGLERKSIRTEGEKTDAFEPKILTTGSSNENKMDKRKSAPPAMQLPLPNLDNDSASNIKIKPQAIAINNVDEISPSRKIVVESVDQSRDIEVDDSDSNKILMMQTSMSGKTRSDESIIRGNLSGLSFNRDQKTVEKKPLDRGISSQNSDQQVEFDHMQKKQSESLRKEESQGDTAKTSGARDIMKTLLRKNSLVGQSQTGLQNVSNLSSDQSILDKLSPVGEEKVAKKITLGNKFKTEPMGGKGKHLPEKMLGDLQTLKPKLLQSITEEGISGGSPSVSQKASPSPVNKKIPASSEQNDMVAKDEQHDSILQQTLPLDIHAETDDVNVKEKRLARKRADIVKKQTLRQHLSDEKKAVSSLTPVLEKPEPDSNLQSMTKKARTPVKELEIYSEVDNQLRKSDKKDSKMESRPPSQVRLTVSKVPVSSLQNQTIGSEILVDEKLRQSQIVVSSNSSRYSQSLSLDTSPQQIKRADPKDNSDKIFVEIAESLLSQRNVSDQKAQSRRSEIRADDFSPTSSVNHPRKVASVLSNDSHKTDRLFNIGIEPKNGKEVDDYPLDWVDLQKLGATRSIVVSPHRLDRDPQLLRTEAPQTTRVKSQLDTNAIGSHLVSPNLKTTRMRNHMTSSIESFGGAASRESDIFNTSKEIVKKRRDVTDKQTSPFKYMMSHPDDYYKGKTPVPSSSLFKPQRSIAPQPSEAQFEVLNSGRVLSDSNYGGALSVEAKNAHPSISSLQNFQDHYQFLQKMQPSALEQPPIDVQRVYSQAHITSPQRVNIHRVSDSLPVTVNRVASSISPDYPRDSGISRQNHAEMMTGKLSQPRTTLAGRHRLTIPGLHRSMPTVDRLGLPTYLQGLAESHNNAISPLATPHTNTLGVSKAIRNGSTESLGSRRSRQHSIKNDTSNFSTAGLNVLASIQKLQEMGDSIGSVGRKSLESNGEK